MNDPLQQTAQFNTECEADLSRLKGKIAQMEATEVEAASVNSQAQAGADESLGQAADAMDEATIQYVKDTEVE